MRSKVPLSEGDVDRNGVKIHYEIYGDGPRTLLFLPTWSIVHSRVYKAQVPYFSERFRCITFDGRGNGKSDRPGNVAEYSLDNAVADAIAVMDASTTGRAVLVGLSMGGLYASILAAYHPERVEAAILVGTAATIGPGYPFHAAEHFVAKRTLYEGWDKYNRDHWLANYPDFADFFFHQAFVEPHSTRQIEESLAYASDTTGEILVKTVEGRRTPPSFDVSETMYRKVRCPVLMIHGDRDQIQPHARGKLVADLIGAEFVTIPNAGHNPLARYPVKCNALIDEFLERALGPPAPGRRGSSKVDAPRILYVSSPIGLGHARRDLAVVRELRALKPNLQVDWLAQDPVTHLLRSNNERIHPLSARLASESKHIESEAGEHELHAFQALRRMDELLILNFMLFQNAVERGGYDLVVADEAWEIDHFWHEHPELKKTALAWFTDFVGFTPMAAGGEREVFLTTDYNAEMIEHVERNPTVRDCAIFVGEPSDIVPHSFGAGLPAMRDWTSQHFDFSGYIIGEHPEGFGPREVLRRNLGYRPDEQVCIVTVGGSGVGHHLMRRVLGSWPTIRAKIPQLRMILVTGPRISPLLFDAPAGFEVRAFVPDLDRHLAACDVAIVQGGLTTCMELTAAATPFIYFPLRNHFEQNVHVAHRLDRYGAGIRMDYETATPDTMADALIAAMRKPANYRPVDGGGAARAAALLAQLM